MGVLIGGHLILCDDFEWVGRVKIQQKAPLNIDVLLINFSIKKSMTDLQLIS